MEYTKRDRLIALAGVHQAGWCAQGIARRGMADSQAVETCIYSLFQVDPEDVPAVFGGTERIAPGLRQFINQVKGGKERNLDLTRYVIALLQLEHRLESNTAMLGRIAEGIEGAEEQLSHFHLLHANLLARLAGIYSDTVSQLQPRIMVRGEELHLRNPDNQNKIRALLLAGVRSARLWSQVGGRRRQILFQRRGMLETAEALLSETGD